MRVVALDCAGCVLKDQCCPNTPIRKIARSIHESARDKARAIAKTPAYRQSRKDRKKVEILFAHLKCVFRTKPDTDFAASWTGISREGGHGFHGKLDSEFTRSWTVTL